MCTFIPVSPGRLRVVHPPLHLASPSMTPSSSVWPVWHGLSCYRMYSQLACPCEVRRDRDIPFQNSAVLRCVGRRTLAARKRRQYTSTDKHDVTATVVVVAAAALLSSLIPSLRISASRKDRTNPVCVLPVYSLPTRIAYCRTISRLCYS